MEPDVTSQEYLDRMEKLLEAPVLDFNRPIPLPLTDAHKLAAEIETFASERLPGAEDALRLVTVVGQCPALPDHVRVQVNSVLVPVIDGLCVDLRCSQGLAALFQPIKVTEFKRRLAIVPAAPALFKLKRCLSEVAMATASTSLSVWPPGPAGIGPETITVGNVAIVHNYPASLSLNMAPYQAALVAELLASVDALSRVECLFGSFEIWTKRPKLETCEAIIRAWKKGDVSSVTKMPGEDDFQDFIFWFCENELGFADADFSRGLRRGNDSRLASYVTEVIFGVRKISGELALPEDMTVVRKVGGVAQDVSLLSLPENEVYEKLLRFARSRMLSQETPPSRFRIFRPDPGFVNPSVRSSHYKERLDSGRRIYQHNSNWAGAGPELPESSLTDRPISDSGFSVARYAQPSQNTRGGSPASIHPALGERGAGLISVKQAEEDLERVAKESAELEDSGFGMFGIEESLCSVKAVDVERVGRSVGLKPKQAKFLVKRYSGEAQQKDDPTAWRAISRKRNQIRAELKRIYFA